MSDELISKEEGAKILEAAEEKFYGAQEYEYRMGGSGTDTNKNKIPEIDCSHLVFEALKKANIIIPYEYVMTATLNSSKANVYYGTIQPEEVTPGDLIVFDGHAGIVKSTFFDAKTGKFHGTFIHSESYSGGPTTTGFIVDPTSSKAGYNENYYGSKRKPITKFLRPKKEREKPAPPKKTEKPKKNAEAARQHSQMSVMCTTPDVCKTPMGCSTPPVPYQIIASLGDSESTSPNVRFAGSPAFMLDNSTITKVTGDEAGTAGGVKSGSNKNACEPVEGCKTFRVNGKQVVAHGDKFKMNDGNTFGKAICQV